MSNSSIWSIDKTLSGSTTPDQSWPWSNGNEGVLHIPKSPRKEPRHKVVWCHIRGTRFGSLISQLRCRWCILHHQPTGLFSVCDEVYDFAGYIEHFSEFCYSYLWYYVIGLFVVNPCHAYIFRLVFTSLKMCWSTFKRPAVPLEPLRYPFCSSGNHPLYSSECSFSSLITLRLLLLLSLLMILL